MVSHEKLKVYLKPVHHVDNVVTSIIVFDSSTRVVQVSEYNFNERSPVGEPVFSILTCMLLSEPFCVVVND